MTRLTTLSESTLSDSSLTAAEAYRLQGKLAPVYLQIANSEHAFNAYLGMETALKKSTLSLREIEAIKLLVSELNRCDYCLSVHQLKAGAAGLSDAQKLAVRRGDSRTALLENLEGDTRLTTIVCVVRQFFTLPGALTDEQFAELKSVGLSDAELVDIALVAATIFFTNIFNHLNNTQSTLKPAPAL
ncbi:MAG: carboxymuconolactone decarboxylase family protein [Granulosicoccus sp.]|nr:carboxymuconolactone decarboxylase family protein [Granulosicoccus sp.]